MTLNFLALEQSQILLIIIGGIVLFVLIWVSLAGIRSRIRKKDEQKRLENIMTSVQSNEVKATKATPTKDVNAEEVKDESNKEEEKTKEDSNNITFEIDTEKYKPDFLVNYEEKNNISLTNLKNEKLSQDIPINENTFEKDELTEDIPIAIKETNEDLTLTQDAVITNTDNVIIDEEYLYEDDKPVYSFDYEDRSNSEKSNYAKENYTDLVNKYATTYGLDSKLVMAILTQENAYNEINNSNIGANGVMQIESIWNGYEISAYNYETGNVDKERIDSSSLVNPEYAIKIGCMILNNQYMTLYNKYYLNGNITKDEVIIATVISYNKGITAICNLINNYGKDFTSHISETLGGDNDYLKHVFSYLEDMSIIKIQNQNDTPSEVVIDNLTL